MALLKYFYAQSKSLPDPKGPLPIAVKPQAIESANKKVSALLASDYSAKDDDSEPSRGPYITFSVLSGGEAIIANKDRTLVDTLALGKDWASHASLD